MGNTDKEVLEREYVQKLAGLKYWVIRYTGYSRFSIENNRIVKKSWNSVLYGGCLIIIMNLLMVHVLYETTMRVKYLLYTELLIFLELSTIINLLVLNITLSNKTSLAKLINYSIDIDVLLGIKDTKFMREIGEKAFVIMGIPVIFAQVTFVTIIYLTFDVSLIVHITGSTYFVWAFFVFYDVNYLLTHSSFVALRTKYLNVALMKSLNVKMEYMPDVYLFNGLFWKLKHNDLVTFHKKANTERFVEAYKMLFKYKKMFEDSYRFVIFTGIVCITMGSLLCVQTVIIYGRTGIDILRKSLMVGWLILSWGFLFLISLQVDTFSRQIDQTKLICSYAQLKFITDEAVYRFTKAIFRSIEIRVTRISIYGLFYFDTGGTLRIAASTFVYLTAQLQISMPAAEDKIMLNATTTSLPTFTDSKF